MRKAALQALPAGPAGVAQDEGAAAGAVGGVDEVQASISHLITCLIVATLHQTVHWVCFDVSCVHDQAVQAQCHGHLAEGVTKEDHPEGVAVSEGARLAEGEAVACGQINLTPES